MRRCTSPVEACIVRVARVEADFQDRRIGVGEQPLDFRLEIDEARRMRVDRDDQAKFLMTHASDICEAGGEGRPFSLVHLLGFRGPPAGRSAARRDRIDQHQVACAMGGKCAAGADGGILHVVPLVRVVEGPEDDAAGQGEATLRQGLPENCRVFRQEAYGAKLDPVIARRPAFIEHPCPGRIARIASEFHAPGTGSISNSDAHVAGRPSMPATSTQPRVCCDAQAASTI